MNFMFFIAASFFRLLRRPQLPAEGLPKYAETGAVPVLFAPQQKRLYTTRQKTARMPPANHNIIFFGVF